MFGLDKHPSAEPGTPEQTLWKIAEKSKPIKFASNLLSDPDVFNDAVAQADQNLARFLLSIPVAERKQFINDLDLFNPNRDVLLRRAVGLDAKTEEKIHKLFPAGSIWDSLVSYALHQPTTWQIIRLQVEQRLQTQKNINEAQLLQFSYDARHDHRFILKNQNDENVLLLGQGDISAQDVWIVDNALQNLSSFLDRIEQLLGPFSARFCLDRVLLIGLLTGLLNKNHPQAAHILSIAEKYEDISRLPFVQHGLTEIATQVEKPVKDERLHKLQQFWPKYFLAHWHAQAKNQERQTPELRIDDQQRIRQLSWPNGLASETSTGARRLDQLESAKLGESRLQVSLGATGKEEANLWYVRQQQEKVLKQRKQDVLSAFDDLRQAYLTDSKTYSPTNRLLEIAQPLGNQLAQTLVQELLNVQKSSPEDRASQMQACVQKAENLLQRGRPPVLVRELYSTQQAMVDDIEKIGIFCAFTLNLRLDKNVQQQLVYAHSHVLQDKLQAYQRKEIGDPVPQSSSFTPFSLQKYEPLAQAAYAKLGQLQLEDGIVSCEQPEALKILQDRVQQLAFLDQSLKIILRTNPELLKRVHGGISFVGFLASSGFGLSMYLALSGAVPEVRPFIGPLFVVGSTLLTGKLMLDPQLERIDTMRKNLLELSPLQRNVVSRNNELKMELEQKFEKNTRQLLRLFTTVVASSAIAMGVVDGGAQFINRSKTAQENVAASREENTIEALLSPQIPTPGIDRAELLAKQPIQEYGKILHAPPNLIQKDQTFTFQPTYKNDYLGNAQNELLGNLLPPRTQPPDQWPDRYTYLTHPITPASENAIAIANEKQLQFTDQQVVIQLDKVPFAYYAPRGFQIGKVYYSGGSVSSVINNKEAFFDSKHPPRTVWVVLNKESDPELRREGFVYSPAKNLANVEASKLTKETIQANLEKKYPGIQLKDQALLDLYVTYVQKAYMLKQIDPENTVAFSALYREATHAFQEYVQQHRMYSLRTGGGSNVTGFQPHTILYALQNPQEGWSCYEANEMYTKFMQTIGAFARQETGVVLRERYGTLAYKVGHETSSVFLPDGTILEMDVTPGRRTPGEDLSMLEMPSTTEEEQQLQRRLGILASSLIVLAGVGAVSLASHFQVSEKLRRRIQQRRAEKSGTNVATILPEHIQEISVDPATLKAADHILQYLLSYQLENANGTLHSRYPSLDDFAASIANDAVRIYLQREPTLSAFSETELLLQAKTRVQANEQRVEYETSLVFSRIRAKLAQVRQSIQGELEKEEAETMNNIVQRKMEVESGDEGSVPTSDVRETDAQLLQLHADILEIQNAQQRLRNLNPLLSFLGKIEQACTVKGA